jgi:hypothetical protein
MASRGWQGLLRLTLEALSLVGWAHPERTPMVRALERN